MQRTQRKTAPCSAHPLSPTDAPKKKRKEKKAAQLKQKISALVATQPDTGRERKQVLAHNRKK
jgi:hypothetical protein